MKKKKFLNLVTAVVTTYLVSPRENKYLYCICIWSNCIWSNSVGYNWPGFNNVWSKCVVWYTLGAGGGCLKKKPEAVATVLRYTLEMMTEGSGYILEMWTSADWTSPDWTSADWTSADWTSKIPNVKYDPTLNMTQRQKRPNVEYDQRRIRLNVKNGTTKLLNVKSECRMGQCRKFVTMQ